MLVAELCGKIGPTSPPDARSEDVLTSEVLSLFRYLSNPYVPCKILSRARNANDDPWHDSRFTAIDTYFWPRFTVRGDRRSREPDVVLILHREDGTRLKVVVEAKYESGPSTVEATSFDGLEQEHASMEKGEGFSGNQLADEYCGLKCGDWPGLEVMRDLVEGRVLYITAHYERPQAHFEEAVKTLEKKRQEPECRECVARARRDFYWLGWRDVYEELCAIERTDYADYQPGEVQLLKDVRSVLQLRGLKRFRLNLDVKAVQQYTPLFPATNGLRATENLRNPGGYVSFLQNICCGGRN